MQPTASSFMAVIPSYVRPLTWCAVLLALFIGTLLQASDLPPAFIISLPFQANEATPVWLGHPETPQTTFATLNLPIQAPDPTASLLVTVFFQEKEGGFLRITWQGAQAAQLLSDNFYEGIGMNNQRSLLISPETLAGGGVLNFQCGDTALGIQRIKLEWLEAKNDLGSAQVHDVLVTPETGPTQPAQNLNGQPKPSDPAAWKDQVVTVPITELPQRIEQGVEFSVQLDNVPSSGRLVLKEAGLSLSKHLIVWINQKNVGTVTPVVPDLSDAGYLTDDVDTYVGWREGSFYVPVTFLKVGANTVQFSSEDNVPPTQTAASDLATTPPLAVKNVAFQLNYLTPPLQDNGVAPSSQTNAAPADTALPTGPVEASPSPSTPTEIPAP